MTVVIRIITGGPLLMPPKPKITEKKKKGRMKLDGNIHYQSRFYSFSFALIECMGYNFKFASVVL